MDFSEIINSKRKQEEKKMSKIFNLKNRFSLRTQNLTLGYCPITGIILEIGIPFLPSSILLTYKNPLADMTNAIGIMSLPYSAIAKTKTEVLAGCLLTILQHHDLIQDKLSNVERNEILCTFPAFDIYTLARTILSYSERRISTFPRLSLKECCSFSIPELLKIYNELCIKSDAVERIETIQAVFHIPTKPRQTKIVEKEITQETRKRIKELVSCIVIENIVTPKFSTVLNFLYQGSTLKLMPTETKKIIIAKLDAMEKDNADELSNIIFDSIVEEKEIQESEISEISYSKRKTIREILAEKQAKKEKEEKQEKEGDNSDEF